VAQTFSFSFQAYLPNNEDSQFTIKKVEFSSENINANYNPRVLIPGKNAPNLLFQDDFNGKTLDTEKWDTTSLPNPISVIVNNGSLIMNAEAGIVSTICITSRENTIKPPINVTFRARIENFDDANCYAGWIYSKETGQEADVLEVWLDDTQYFSVHATGNEWINSYEAKPVDLSLWHDYTMLITEGGCESYIDGELVMQCFGLNAEDFDVRISIWSNTLAKKNSVLFIDSVKIYSCSNLNWKFSNEL
jgi:hypothetical protein